MVRSLTFAITALLVSSTVAQRSLVQRFNGFLFPRAVETDLDDCRETNGYENDVLTRFTGIFFGDFYTGGGTDILGGLAVEGNFHAPNYVVNANHGADCSDPDSLNSYGLVVKGITDTFNTHVHGNSFLNSGGTVEEVLELDTGCFVTDQAGTGIFDFDLVKQMSIASNQDFANLQPTVVLESDGSLTELRDGQLANYEIITFHSCEGAICSSFNEIESDPSAILLGQGNWNGVQGSEIDPDKTYVLNIPVTNGATIEIDTNNPTLGFNPCKLIYNFYPVDEAGQYLPDGEFTLIRRTANQFGGFTLAPRGHIVDGSVGNFSGNLIGLDYTWENLDAGVEIHDYAAAGGDCDQFIGCVPVHVTSEPPPVPIPSSTSITKSRTKTWSRTKTISSTSETTTVTYSPQPEPTDDISTSTYSPCPADTTETTTIITTTTTSIDDLTETVTLTVPNETGTTTVTEASFTLTESGTTLTTTVKATTTKTLVIIRPVTRTESNCSNSASVCEPETMVEECTTTEEDHGHHHKDKKKKHHHKDDEDDEDEDDDDDEDDKDDEDEDEDDDEDEDEDEHKKKWHKDDEEDGEKQWEGKNDNKNY